MGKRQYGDGSVYQRKSDGRWIGTIEAGWTKNGTRRRVTVTAKTEAECKRKKRDKIKEIEREGSAPTGHATVKAWAEEWLKMTERTARPKTHTTDTGAVKAWIIPTIGHKRLDHLTPADVRAVAEAIRTAGKSTTTAHRYHGVLRRMLKAAILDGYSVPPRVLLAEAPAIAPDDRQSLTVPQALAVLEVASELDYASRWVTALLQGMRQGECLGLTWEAVDLNRDLLTISWQLQALPYIDAKNKPLGFRVPDGYEVRRLTGAYHLVRPKSKAGWRVIPLVPWVHNALERWQETAPPSPHGLVWPRLDGSPTNPRHDAEEWEALQCAAGVGHPSGRWYYLHEARHTTATLLMEADVPESVRIAIMGHSSIAVTRGYEFASQDQARAALGRVADRLHLGQ